VDFLTPYSFHRVYLRKDVSADSSTPCWTINYNGWDWVCVVYMIENNTFFRYTGTTRGEWNWTPVATDVAPRVDGYTYTWTVPRVTSGGPDSGPHAFGDAVVVQGEGYGPFTNHFHPCPGLTPLACAG
jgi:hypothetical protein